MPQEIARHKTALTRPSLSRPVKLALEDGLLHSGTRIFDYGCGRGDDLRMLHSLGIEGSGWDPVHQPDKPLRSAPIVNLGYVVNVIEDPRERQETLIRAWSLTERLLIVSARLVVEARDTGQIESFADGYLTSRGTFQKFFEQHELKDWVEQVLGTAAIAAGPGVFYVFRDEKDHATFLASRYRRRAVVPRLTRSEALFNQYQPLLQPLMHFVAERGRLPVDHEIANIAKLHEVFGTTKRAFRLIEQMTEKTQWTQITEERTQDLLIAIALSRFDGRPKFAQLPLDLQYDIKSFFSTYKQACTQADNLLFSVGNMALVNQACEASKVGKLTPTALYCHVRALELLSPILRVFEGCARGYIGRVEEANIIKLYRHEPIVSYLIYPDFEVDPHPALAYSLTVHFQTLRIESRDYRNYQNPPILHRKETFLPPNHPLYAKFARLTRMEEAKGLYKNTRRIGTREGWKDLLEEKGVCLRGHRLLKKLDL